MSNKIISSILINLSFYLFTIKTESVYPKARPFWGNFGILPDSYKIKQDIPIPRICNPATRFRKTCYKNCDILRQVFKAFPPSF